MTLLQLGATETTELTVSSYRKHPENVYILYVHVRFSGINKLANLVHIQIERGEHHSAYTVCTVVILMTYESYCTDCENET